MSKGKLFGKPRICCDTNCFIALFQGEVVNGVQRGKICQKVVEDARSGRIELFVSWSAVAECRKPNSPKVEEFFDNAYIKMCDVDRFVALKAREIALRAPRKLGTLDALQLATAILQQVDYLFTYDGNDLGSLNEHSAVEGLKICAPCRPWDTQTSLDEAVILTTDNELPSDVKPEAITDEPN